MNIYWFIDGSLTVFKLISTPDRKATQKLLEEVASQNPPLKTFASGKQFHLLHITKNIDKEGHIATIAEIAGNGTHVVVRDIPGGKSKKQYKLSILFT